MVGSTQGTWVWMDSRSWWWTGRPGMLQFMGSQSQTRLSNWTELNWWGYWDQSSGDDCIIGVLVLFGNRMSIHWISSNHLGVYYQQMLTMVESDLSPANLKIKWLSSGCKGFFFSFIIFSTFQRYEEKANSHISKQESIGIQQLCFVI